MSIIQHRFLPRSMFDMDLWTRPAHSGFGPSTLDLFDPFDELDRMIGRNLLWLNTPSFFDDMFPSRPKVPEKYRIKVDCRGYKSDSLKIDISNDKTKLIVNGSEGDNKSNEDDYSLKEFRKTYKLPENAETDKMVSFLTSHGQLVIEIPLKIEEKNKSIKNQDLFPKIVDNQDGSKQVQMNFIVPKSIDPSKIKVTCKDRDLIIQAEDKQEKEDGISQMSYYRRTTLPENTDFNSLKCIFDNNKLSIEAPLNLNYNNSNKTIPIEHKKLHDDKN